MTWAFRILASLNALLIAVLFFYRASGEDPAGEGMRLAVASLMLGAYALIVALYVFVKWRPLRIAMLLMLLVPILITLYGITLMLG